jgi:hypothetical protein
MDASQARTLHIRAWVSAAGGPTEFSSAYGDGRWTPAQVSQWTSASNPKGIGHKLARDIERALGHPRGTMDVPPADSGTDPVRLKDAMTLLTYLGDLQGVPGLQYDPHSLAIAYDFLAAIDAPTDKTNVLDITSRLAEKLRGRALEHGSPKRRGTDAVGDDAGGTSGGATA